jgi:hypothetical protein
MGTRRLWGRIFQLLLGGAIVLYLGDWLVASVRPQAGSTVQVEQFLRTPLKGQKEEFDYMGKIAEPCIRSIFPHRADTPCWWLERHKIEWVSP